MTLTRRPPPEDPVAALAAFAYPLATAELAAIMAEHLTEPDREKTERALIEPTGRVVHRPAGDGALWSPA